MCLWARSQKADGCCDLGVGKEAVTKSGKRIRRVLTNQAFISGTVGRALYVNADEWWVSDHGLSPRPARTGEIAELRSSKSEYRPTQFSSLSALDEQLEIEVDFQNALFLVLCIFDPDTSLNTRLNCARAVEPALEAVSCWSRVRDRLLSAPLALDARDSK